MVLSQVELGLMEPWIGLEKYLDVPMSPNSCGIVSPFGNPTGCLLLQISLNTCADPHFAIFPPKPQGSLGEI